MATVSVGIDEESRIFAMLAAKFADAQQRKGQGGKIFAFITAEQIMNRLDDAVGPSNWEFAITTEGDKVHCVIKLRMPDGRTIQRCGSSAFEYRDDKGNEKKLSNVMKTGYGDAFKVAAKAFGVGRYLKEHAGFPRYARRFWAESGEIADGPKSALKAPERFPATAPGPSEPPRAEEFPTRQGAGRFGNRPGTQLFRTLSNAPYSKHDLDLIAEYGRKHGFPDRIVNWNGEQCEEAMEALGAGIINTRE